MQIIKYTTDRHEIDGLRGVACLIVLVFHALAQHAPQWGTYLTGTARVGVWLFFVLSAFLLTLGMLDRGFSAKSMVDYAVARFLRIIPLFVLSVLLYHLLGIIGLGPWPDVLRALTFSNFYNHLWTVPIEFEFYAVLPFVVIAARFLADRVSFAAAATGLIGFASVSVAMTRPWDNPDVIALARYLACFSFGILAAFCVRYLPRPSPLLAARMAILALAAIFVFIAVMKSGLAGDPRDAISGHHYFFGAMFAVVTYSVYSERTAISDALCYKPLSAFGLTIYSTYLFHWVPMHYVAVKQTWWAIPASIAISIALGWLGYWFLERRLHKLRDPISRLIWQWTLREVPVNN